jgi:hypothetical protein
VKNAQVRVMKCFVALRWVLEEGTANPWFHYTAATAGALIVLVWDRISKSRHANKDKEPEAS